MNFALKGNIYYAPSSADLQIHENSYVVCVQGHSMGVFETLPEEYKHLEIIDYSGKSILPGLVDLHIHAPQYAFRGLGMDRQLIEWLSAHVYAEESKFIDTKYAEKAYGYFVHDMVKSATTRACIFATRHKDATIMLMDMLEKAHMVAYVGKVSMDRNADPELVEKNSETAAQDTIAWIEQCAYLRTIKPILTPRFIPSCSDDLLHKLRAIHEKYTLPLQSHLSENLQEIQWVKKLCPQAAFYGDAYNQYKLFGKDIPTIMAHCVHSSAEEVALLKENGVFIAHCPQSNTNLASGIAPIRHYLEQDMRIGLGSDVAGGSSLSIFKAMVDAIQVSKLRSTLLDNSTPLSVKEVFYLGTKAGGAFFGKVGSFEKEYEFDALIIDDAQIPNPQTLTPYERLEKILYLYEDTLLKAKFVKGKKLF